MRTVSSERTMRTRWSIVCLCPGCCVVVPLPAPAAAWGFEPPQIHHGAARSRCCPPQIRPFFLKYQTTIVEHAIDPDLWRTAGWEQEPPRHFLDMDAYGPYPFPDFPQRVATRRSSATGSSSWRRTASCRGAATEIYQKLVEAFRAAGAVLARQHQVLLVGARRTTSPTPTCRSTRSLNYDGQLTGQWGIHSRFETELFERYRAIAARRAEAGRCRWPTRATSSSTTLIGELPARRRPVLDADKAAVAGREVYDDRYFTLFFGKVAADPRAAARRRDHRRRRR